MPGTKGGQGRTGLRRLAGEYHAPGQIGLSPPQFRIHEIGNPAQQDGGRRRQRDGIRRRPQRDILPPGKDIYRQHHPDKPAMKRHPPLPQDRDFDRMRQIIGRFIQQHIPQPPARDDAHNDPCQQVFQLCRGHRRGGIGPEFRPVQCGDRDAPADHDPHDIGQRIPAQRHGIAEQPIGEHKGRQVGKGDTGLHSARFGVRVRRSQSALVPCVRALAGPYWSGISQKVKPCKARTRFSTTCRN